jgi:hypothetical protein
MTPCKQIFFVFSTSCSNSFQRFSTVFPFSFFHNPFEIFWNSSLFFFHGAFGGIFWEQRNKSTRTHSQLLISSLLLPKSFSGPTNYCSLPALLFLFFLPFARMYAYGIPSLMLKTHILQGLAGFDWTRIVRLERRSTSKISISLRKMKVYGRYRHCGLF